MSAALQLLEECISEALAEEGVAPTAAQTAAVAQAVADWLDMLPTEGAVALDVRSMRLPAAALPFADYWSPRTLQGLALMLRRGR